ncbi:MAG: hypothetical protein ACI9FJ_000771, partial [Alteromonadaceae bacterium]
PSMSIRCPLWCVLDKCAPALSTHGRPALVSPSMAPLGVVHRDPLVVHVWRSVVIAIAVITVLMFRSSYLCPFRRSRGIIFSLLPHDLFNDFNQQTAFYLRQLGVNNPHTIFVVLY